MREDWIECSLIEGCDIHDNLRKPINSKERNERINGKSEEQLFPYYGATGQVGFIDDYLTDGEFVLIGEDAAPFLDYSKDVAYQISGKTWVNNHAHILKSKFNDEFLRHYLNNFNYKDYVSGTTRLKLTQGRLKQIPLKIAPLPEQRAIVAKIEELFSDLDKGIADLKKAQDKLKVYRQAVLKKAFEGDFTVDWRNKAGTDVKWNKFSFDEITESLKRGPFGGDLKKAFFVESGYAVYEQQHAINDDFNTIRYFIDQERYDKLAACNVGPGDYIVSCSGTMGKIARLPKDSPSGVINQALLRIRINEKIISHEYFLIFFKSSMFQRKILKDSRGSGMQNMAGIKEIKPIEIDLPSLEEQQQIVQEIESRLSVCDKVEESITESLEKAKALRQSILKKAFVGTLLSQEEIAACKAAPDYEPASVLLEKIKAEKKK